MSMDLTLYKQVLNVTLEEVATASSGSIIKDANQIIGDFLEENATSVSDDDKAKIFVQFITNTVSTAITQAIVQAGTIAISYELEGAIKLKEIELKEQEIELRQNEARLAEKEIELKEQEIKNSVTMMQIESQKLGIAKDELAIKKSESKSSIDLSEAQRKLAENQGEAVMKSLETQVKIEASRNQKDIAVAELYVGARE